MSGVSTPETAEMYFTNWREKIEQNPQLWRDGWSLERLRVAIRIGFTNMISSFSRLEARTHELVSVIDAPQNRRCPSRRKPKEDDEHD
jgi:hypothetical protein